MFCVSQRGIIHSILSTPGQKHIIEYGFKYLNTLRGMSYFTRHFNTRKIGQIKGSSCISSSIQSISKYSKYVQVLLCQGLEKHTASIE